MKDRHSYEFHNGCREERNRRRRAYKRLDPRDKKIIQCEMQRLARCTKLSEVQLFDLLGAIGEWLAKQEAA
jgi:hypothetical protein